MKPNNKNSSKRVVELLEQQRALIQRRFRVKELGLFGSHVRGQAREKSDVDILVKFDPRYETFDNYMDLLFFLEGLLDSKVDLVTKRALRKELRGRILSEAVYV